ncbi:hypothetical protein [Nonomuraea sp. SBT364]|uniref:hypothetical protein n=1 Tax=Nonomuraea sp. SBT364 TaxID=1580530 RepID=UPI00066A1697|nr:hypothetical protein [Nonomuraea sp. SBT364]
MDGFLDTTSRGLTELRVHGVSGTPPDQMLNHPHPRLVSGDSTTGFYRRWWPAGRPEGEQADVPDVRHREAYAWGGLTSGGRTIALWLLLLPFSLANLAYFMLPRPARGRRLRHVVEAAQRLFALLLTGTLVQAVIGSSVDLVGWQCTAAGRACTYETAPVWVRWLGELWGVEESRRLAVTALVPLAVVGLLWLIARRTWNRDERTAMPSGGRSGGSPAGSEDAALPLARRRLWQGDVPVWRLRAVHVAYALSAIGLAVSVPFAGAGRALTAANAAVQVAAAVLVLLPGLARRVDPGGADAGGRALTAACRILEAAAPAVLAATLVAALAGLPLGGPRGAALQLPGVGAVRFALLVALVAFLLAATWVLARLTAPAERPAMRGMASWFTLMVAAGSANALALGVMFWTASFFGVPESPARAQPIGRKLFLGDAVWWTAALVPILVLGLLCAGVVLWRIRRAATELLTPKLTPYYGDDGDDVAGKWALASLTDRAGLVLGLLVGVMLTGFAVVTVIYQFGLITPVGGTAGLFATIGSWAITAILVGLVLLGRRTYSDPALRRTIGILWDVATFWPRAIHPLSPPCYTERVLPELVARVGVLSRQERDTVVLSGHSQGSVIAAALVLQLGPADRERVRLLTHGSPLRRLYAAFFPAYFGGPSLPSVREAVPWVNLYRLSDPIGGPVFAPADPFGPLASPGGREPVDVFCWDPPQPEPGEPLAELRWHSDYWFDPPYDQAMARLTG